MSSMKVQITSEKAVIDNFSAEIDYEEKVINDITLSNEQIIEYIGFDELAGLINCLQMIEKRIKDGQNQLT